MAETRESALPVRPFSKWSESTPSYSKMFDYDVNGNLIYFGQAVPGSQTSDSKWEIRQFNYSVTGNLLSVLYAGGVLDFRNVWDNRTGLTYS